MRHLRSAQAIDRIVIKLVLGIVATTLVASTACSNNPKPVTQENSPEGRVAVYATKVVDGVRAVTDAVKAAEAKQLIPTDAARKVVTAATAIDTKADELGQLLQVYDAFTPSTPSGDAASQIDSIRVKLNEISELVQQLYVPAGGDPAVAVQIAELTGAVNQTLITLALELAKGVS